MKDTEETNNIAERLSNCFSGPILLNYVWWVLIQARKMGLKRLYFLARDGYLLREIAMLFCETFDLSIDCRYLYVSRASLRMPTYHFIGDEAWELLTAGGYQVTPRSLLSRGNLTNEQRQAVYRDCGVEVAEEDRNLSRQELEEWREMLKSSSQYREFVIENSKASYEAAIGYMLQERLFDCGDIALVDSGWVGTMQRSLRQLVDSAGFSGHLTGFYFGMYAEPKSPEDGAYLTWYFDHSSSPFIKANFCNNLFECILAAPHGMTTGYELREGRYFPVTGSPPRGKDLAHIVEQVSAVLEYTKQELTSLDFNAFKEREALQLTRKLTRRYMAHPLLEEASYYGELNFCDDVMSVYMYSLANESQIGTLKEYSIPKRVLRRFKGQNETIPELYWPYGTIAFLPFWKQWWYRINIFTWEFLRHVLR